MTTSQHYIAFCRLASSFCLLNNRVQSTEAQVKYNNQVLSVSPLLNKSHLFPMCNYVINGHHFFGSLLARHTGEDESTTTKHLFQQLPIALVKGNAALMNNRNPGAAFERDEGIGW